MQRISVVGPPGAGKSTLGQNLARRLGLTWIELDRYYHMPGWTPRERDAFRADIQQQVDASPGWVVDGNYNSLVQDLIWERADTVIWLDLPRHVVLPALLARSFSRGLRREELWNGNREDLRNLLRTDPEQNLVLWCITRFEGYRTRYCRAMVDPRWRHLRFVRLGSRAEIAALLDQVS